jgi:hypothetical protein
MKDKILLTLLPILYFCFRLNAQDAEVLNESTIASINNNKLSIAYSVSIQINNRRGEDLTIFHVYTSKTQKLKDIEGSITSVDGTILNKLSKKEIKKVSSVSEGSFYTDDYTYFFTLRHNTYPYIVDCSYKVEYDEFLDISLWSPMYSRNYPTRNSGLTVIVPKDYPINIKEQGIHYVNFTDSKGNVVYKWESSYKDIIKDEIYSSDIYEVIPWVNVAPVNFYYGVAGSLQTWATFGLWVSNLMNGLNDLPLSEKVKVQEITKGMTDPKTKVNALYHYLQDNTRYINVSLGIGGLKPYPASYVAYNKYGDCKALTNYMKSLLESAGIKSYYTLIHAGYSIAPFYSDFPSSQFNHVFLMVPIEKDTIWLECTDQSNPIGYLGPFTQNRTAAVINGEQSALVHTPALTDSDVLVKTDAQLDINLNGKSNVDAKIVCKGAKYEFFKNSSVVKPIKDQQEDISDFLDIPNIDNLKWQFEPQNRDSASITLNLEFETNSICKQYGNDYILNNVPVNLPKFENPKDRKLSLVFDYPIWSNYSIKYNLPANAKIKFIPADTILSNRFGTYEIKYKIVEQSILTEYSIHLYRGKYSTEKYPAFYEFIKSIYAIERKNHPILSL